MYFMVHICCCFHCNRWIFILAITLFLFVLHFNSPLLYLKDERAFIYDTNVYIIDRPIFLANKHCDRQLLMIFKRQPSPPPPSSSRSPTNLRFTAMKSPASISSTSASISVREYQPPTGYVLVPVNSMTQAFLSVFAPSSFPNLVTTKNKNKKRIKSGDSCVERMKLKKKSKLVPSGPGSAGLAKKKGVPPPYYISIAPYCT